MDAAKKRKARLEFGRQPPKGARVAWGARAIFKPVGRNPMIDILWDRQDAFGPEEERRILVDWVRMVGLPAIQTTLEEEPAFTLSMSKEVFRFEDEEHVIEASPQRSGGYLYIGAWRKS